MYGNGVLTEVGSYQSDANKKHNHGGATNNDGAHVHSITNGLRVRGNENGSNEYTLARTGGNAYSLSTSPGGGVHQHALNMDGNEDSRPKNVNVHFIIKY